MDEQNVPIGAIQRILGHENRRTTEIHLYSVSEMEREAMATYERARKKFYPDFHREEEGQKKRVRRVHLTLVKHKLFQVPGPRIELGTRGFSVR
jgi:hypothetical protein